MKNIMYSLESRAGTEVRTGKKTQRETLWCQVPASVPLTCVAKLGRLYPHARGLRGCLSARYPSVGKSQLHRSFSEPPLIAHDLIFSTEGGRRLRNCPSVSYRVGRWGILVIQSVMVSTSRSMPLNVWNLIGIVALRSPPPPSVISKSRGGYLRYIRFQSMDLCRRMGVYLFDASPDSIVAG
ncbi:uncharacterized protein EI90DRAFT_1740451 [Cantharellus anzutake]|uniref:uncharacterized protein n=1 Tax=Cantharellus anzutake TaxID=1750568 RepID=UPI001906C550|nr:uncharacterized protein EI90DRAFT_1740451 [Cantharellus anzutake]KAF8341460.1 hypothetical protein EI90DRAFT_1740451 [Cantharellus anzutake]